MKQKYSIIEKEAWNEGMEEVGRKEMRKVEEKEGREVVNHKRRYFNDETGDRGRSPRSRRGRSSVKPIWGVINTISGGFIGGGVSSSSRKRHVRSSRTTHSTYERSIPTITFIGEDFQDIDPEQDDPTLQKKLLLATTKFGR